MKMRGRGRRMAERAGTGWQRCTPKKSWGTEKTCGHRGAHPVSTKIQKGLGGPWEGRIFEGLFVVYWESYVQFYSFLRGIGKPNIWFVDCPTFSSIQYSSLCVFSMVCCSGSQTQPPPL